MSSFSNSDPHLQNPDAPELKVTHEGEHHGDFGDVPIKITRWTYIYAFCAAVNSCNLGYDIGVSTEAGKLIQDHFNLTTFQRELFLGSMNFWSSTYECTGATIAVDLESPLIPFASLLQSLVPLVLSTLQINSDGGGRSSLRRSALSWEW